MLSLHLPLFAVKRVPQRVNVRQLPEQLFNLFAIKANVKTLFVLATPLLAQSVVAVQCQMVLLVAPCVAQMVILSIQLTAKMAAFAVIAKTVALPAIGVCPDQHQAVT